MKVLLVSSKFQPEYSGSGYRAHHLYQRFSSKFNIDYDVVCNTLINRKNEIYEYDGVKINKISYPIEIEKLHGLKRKFHSFLSIQFKSHFRKIFKKNNTIMVAISKELEELCKKNEVKNIWTRPNPIDEKIFFYVDNKYKIKIRNKLIHFSNEDIILTHIASYMKRKNHIFTLEILKKLPKKYKLYLGGPVQSNEHKENFELVRKKIVELNLSDRVILSKGFIKNIDQYIKLSDVFLFPTWDEGLGTPILESQACGVPVVSNLMKGVNDYLIKEGVGGYLVEKFDANIWAEKIVSATNIKNETLKENSLKIIKNFSTKNIDLEYFKIIQSIT